MMPAMKQSVLIRQLRTLLEAHGGIELAMLFGSLSTSRARADSDIDIAVLAGQPLSPADKYALVEKITLLTGRPVDLIDLRTAGEPLLGEVLKGKRILGGDESYARLLTRHLLDSADFGPLQQRILRERRERWLSQGPVTGESSSASVTTSWPISSGSPDPVRPALETGQWRHAGRYRWDMTS